MLRLGWFSTGRGPGSRNLLKSVMDKKADGTLDIEKDQYGFAATWWGTPINIIWTAGLRIVQGVGEGPTRHDFYGFLLWGVPVGVGIFIALTLLTWGLALLMRKLGGAVETVRH